MGSIMLVMVVLATHMLTTAQASMKPRAGQHEAAHSATGRYLNRFTKRFMR